MREKMKRILCPFHAEATASMALYPEGGFCFGCGKWATYKELGLAKENVSAEYKTEPEDLQSTIQSIKKLPIKNIRGLQCYVGDTGYYILWPGEIYYKFRSFEADIKSKYRCPKGHKQPILELGNKNSPDLIIVEGEINALSAETAGPEYRIISPGGAQQFDERLATCTNDKTDRVVFLVDNDAAGAQAYIYGATFTQSKAPYIRVKRLLMDRDCNEILVQDGKEKLREIIETALHN